MEFAALFLWILSELIMTMMDIYWHCSAMAKFARNL